MSGEITSVLDPRECVQLLQRMVQTPSVNPPGGELRCGELVAAALREGGLEARIIPLADDRCNVVTRLPGAGRAPALLFNGHLDTVPPGDRQWERDPFSGEIEGDRLHGLGASDMKSGVAAMVLAAVALHRSGIRLKGDLVVAATAGEESDSIGARAFMDSADFEGIGAAVITEPTSLDVHIAEKGALWLELMVRGRTSHGSRPDLGLNAVVHAHVLLQRVLAYRFRHRPHPLLSAPTLSVNTISGGVKTNVVPDSCAITVDMRTLPGQEHQNIVEDYEAMIEETAREVEGFSASVTVLNDRPPVETDAGDPLVAAAQAAVKSVLGRDIKIGGITAYTDASVFVDRRIPQIILGPGNMAEAHRPNEGASVSQFLEGIEVLAVLAREYLGEAS